MGARIALARRAAGVPRASSSPTRWPRSSAAVSAPDGAWRPRPLGEVADRPGCARRVVHGVAGDGRPPCSRSSSRSPARTCFARFDFPGQALLRAWSRCRSCCRRSSSARRSWRCSSVAVCALGPRHRTSLGDPARARLLQLRGRRAHRRRAVVAPRPPPGGGRAGARREPWRAFRQVTLPALRPAIAAAALIVFLFTFTSFGVILILGGPGTPRSRPRSTARPRSCSTCRSPPCSSMVQFAVVAALLAFARAGPTPHEGVRVAAGRRAAARRAPAAGTPAQWAFARRRTSR